MTQKPPPGLRVQPLNLGTKSALALAGSPSVIAHILPAFMQKQQQANWCWSAAGTSVGIFFQTGSWTQCDTATGCLNQLNPGKTYNCCSNAKPCNVYGYLDVSLTYCLSYASMVSGTVSATTVEGQINMGRPVCVRVAWTGGGAHFLAMSGYSYPEADPSAVTIYLQDSIYGSSSMKFTNFPSKYHGGGTWTHTYYTKSN
ncbi:MAG: papain-like cysteine protease family protein [Thermoanaerobaculia bacterium]|nr:papain-like cysteine protease family protein [Thermoanaerobaculia bacterium]